MSNPFDPPLTADEISRYFPNITSIESLTSGGEGSIFKGFCTVTQKKIAIKIYSPDRLERRTELEVQKMKQCSCEYLVSFIDYGKISLRGLDCLYIVTEYIEGVTINKLITQQMVFAPEEIANMIQCITKAIDVLWHLNVVHCDITPKNIIRKNNGEYILIDLGIAKHLDAETITRYGIIFGTPGYIAPEQFQGRKNITLRADFYSLGIVVYQALVGKHPFNYRQELMNTQPPQIPDTVNVSQPIKELLYRMVDPLPYRRPANYQEIMNYLGRA